MRRGSLSRNGKAAQSVGDAFIALSEHRRDSEVEAWICRELRSRDLFAGTTTREIRRDRLVAALNARHLTDSHAGRVGGKACTWRELVVKLYGEQQLSMDVHKL